MNNTKKYLGARIQEIRKQRYLKQAQLAELVGIDSKHISKIECGRCFPSFELLDKIALHLNKPVSDFLSTEHLKSREDLITELINKLKISTDDKLHTAYKILMEIL